MKIKQIGESVPPSNTSYIITDCQTKLDKQMDKKDDWIQLQRVFQNLKGKNIATIQGTLEKTKDVVVKIQPFSESMREYQFQEILKIERGFVDFHCIVSCGSPKEYIESYGNSGQPKQQLCDRKGNVLGIIVMPYYKNGSLEDFLKKNNKIDKLKKIKTIVALVIVCYFVAYKNHMFIHGDLFTKNILIDDNYLPLIIDFEKSSFGDSNKTRYFWRDLQNFLEDVYRYTKINQIDTIIKNHILMNMAYNKEPTLKIIKEIKNEILETNYII